MVRGDSQKNQQKKIATDWEKGTAKIEDHQSACRCCTKKRFKSQF